MKIFVTTDFVAFHNWPGAPQEVEFLRSLHRHIFRVKVVWKVEHDNRDLEFFIQKEKLNKFLQENFSNKNLIGVSCEMMANKIKTEFNAESVEVSEDGENGAIV